MTDLDLNSDFVRALRLLEEGEDSLFITGRAGTGKSTLLKHFQKVSAQNVIILAPTGVAAVNVGGSTIHSFFGFKPDITLDKAWKLGGKAKNPELYRQLDALVIDEISMVRADLLDCVDAFMRRVCGNVHPFGGKRLVMFGDLYQLPPVVTRDEESVYRSRYSSPFFFSADVFSRLKLEYVELEHIYRQSDPTFINLLNAVRENRLTKVELALLNARVYADYAPPPEEYVVYLTGTNRDAELYNTYQLNSLGGELHTFNAQSTGEFDQRTEPAPRLLALKIGAQVMLTSNDRGKRFINGTVGRIEDISRDDTGPVVSVRLSTGELVDITKNSWEMFKFGYNPLTRRITSDVAGTYTQLPLMLSWGITIHKAQGKTFDKVAIDLPRSFAHGQTYVALSRATSLQGLILKRPLTLHHVIMDPAVTTWLAMLRNTTPSQF